MDCLLDFKIFQINKNSTFPSVAILPRSSLVSVSKPIRLLRAVLMDLVIQYKA